MFLRSLMFHSGVHEMLQFLSSVVVVALLSGAIGLIVSTIRESSDAVIAAIMGTPKLTNAPEAAPRRVIRQSRPTSPYYAPLRAAA
jgi:hypothetical protein